MVTWKWLEIGALMPSVLDSVPLTVIGSQFVGLNMNSGRLITTLIVPDRTGCRPTIVGSASVVTVNCAVCGSTSTVARTTCSRAQVERTGPPGTSIERPNGAPS